MGLSTWSDDKVPRSKAHFLGKEMALTRKATMEEKYFLAAISNMVSTSSDGIQSGPQVVRIVMIVDSENWIRSMMWHL